MNEIRENCPYCGAPVAPNAQFCTACGQPLNRPAVEGEIPPDPQPYHEPEPAPWEPAPVSDQASNPESSAPPPTQPAFTTPPPVPPYTPPPPPMGGPAKGSNTTLIVILIVAAVLIVLCCICAGCLGLFWPAIRSASNGYSFLLPGLAWLA